MGRIGSKTNMSEKEYGGGRVYVCPLCQNAAEAWEILVKHFDEAHSRDCLHPLLHTPES